VTHVSNSTTTASTDRYAPVGAVVYNAYWGYVYRVLSHNDDGSITVRKIDHPRQRYKGRGGDYPIGASWSHRTPLDERDEILSVPIVVTPDLNPITIAVRRTDARRVLKEHGWTIEYDGTYTIPDGLPRAYGGQCGTDYFWQLDEALIEALGFRHGA
jgi:hypothetical protein